eukprot:8909968-Karenia_brevis.AAC.1
MRWVGTNKAWKKGDMDVRSRMVARHFKGRDKDSDDATLCGCEQDLKWIRRLVESWFEIEVRVV